MALEIAQEGRHISGGHTLPRLHALQPDRQKEILGQFTPEQQQLIGDRRKVLSAIGLFIGKDFRMPVELNTPGEGWHWDFKDNVIRIDPQDLIEKPMDYLRFVIAHEGGHRRITRADFIPQDIWQQPGFAFMMNAIEDPRDNNFVAESYPRFREQMQLAYELHKELEQEARQNAQGKLGYQPRFMQAGFAYIDSWFQDIQGEEQKLAESLPPDVATVVTKTLPSAIDSWLHYPSRAEADSSEAIIRQYAEVSYEINRDKVWPDFKTLVDEDRKDQQMQEFMNDLQQGDGQPKSGEGGESKTGKSQLPQELQTQLTVEEQQSLEKALDQASIGEHAGEGEQGQDRETQVGGKGRVIDLDSLPDVLKEKIRQYIDSLPEQKKRELAEKAQKSLQDFEKEVAQAIEGKLTTNPIEREREKADEGKESTTQSEKEGTTTEPTEEELVSQLEKEKRLQEFHDLIEEVVNKDRNIYEETRREVLPEIESLENDLRAIFTARRMNKWKSGHRTGKRIDIKRRIQEKVKGTSAMESKAWQKRELPGQKDYAISILVDLSGSMQESNKIGETFKAVIVLAEVLNRLSIPTEILGFNDRLYSYQSFGQPMPPEIREKMGGMLQEVSDFSDTGRAQWNDDGWALQQTSERLAREKAHEKFILVLSDGQPVESPMHPASRYDLDKVVKGINDGTDQKLIGLGIGQGTTHVEHFYPNSVANINVSQMAESLADVLRSVIENYDTF